MCQSVSTRKPEFSRTARDRGHPALWAPTQYWLIAKTESDIECQYSEIGARRFRQRVPPSEVLSAIVLTKDNLWDSLNSESWPGFELEVLAELHMFRLIDQFLSRALYYAAKGFEQAARTEQALIAAAN